MRRVVITGLGVICPLGNTKEALWEALLAGRSGVVTLTDAQSSAVIAPLAGVARDFSGSIEDFGPLEGDLKKSIRKGLKLMCRESQMGVAAAQRAMSDAKLAQGVYDPERAGIVYGADYMLSDPEEFNAAYAACLAGGRPFDFARWAGEGLPKMSPLWLLKYLPNMPASHIAIYNDLRGPNNSLTLREAAANLAVGEAYNVILRGHAEVMLAGATGTRIHPMKALHASQQEELANGVEPARASRPFDLDRSGMVLGEGAGAVVLEELEFARSRGATIYAEVVSASSSSAADDRRVACRDVALANALRGAISKARMRLEDIGHIQAHGLSTRSCDADEARAINEVFAGRAAAVLVTAAKSYTGNLGAGSGMIELAASTLALQHDRLFPVLNYETPDPECPLAVVRDAETRPGDSFLNTSVTPQGQASCVLVRRFA